MVKMLAGSNGINQQVGCKTGTLPFLIPTGILEVFEVGEDVQFLADT